jgi:hypothetical protein
MTDPLEPDSIIANKLLSDRKAFAAVWASCDVKLFNAAFTTDSNVSYADRPGCVTMVPSCSATHTISMRGRTQATEKQLPYIDPLTRARNRGECGVRSSFNVTLSSARKQHVGDTYTEAAVSQPVVDKQLHLQFKAKQLKAGQPSHTAPRIVTLSKQSRATSGDASFINT